MALIIRTVLTYPLDGSTEFIIPFEYLARKFVTVTLIGQDRKELVLNQDFRFVEKTKIQTSRTWTSNDGYNLIEIRRFTSATERLVDFADGSILRAYDLNISQVQTLHVAEEARDLTADTIGVNNDGNLDARGRRIVNVADAVEAGDVVTLRQMGSWDNSALNSAVKAKTSETNAKTSETNAKTSETNAKTSEDLAHDWAQKAEGVAVSGAEYSAYHYSRKASNSATASATSATASAASETKAKTSETNAKTSETNAKTSETNAAASAQTATDEAAKLGNMNNLAAAIQGVNTTNQQVTWKGEQVAPSFVGQFKAPLGKPLVSDWTVNTDSSRVSNLIRGSVDSNKIGGVNVWMNSAGNNWTELFSIGPNASSFLRFFQDGHFEINGNANFFPDGNITGSAWGGKNLSQYMKDIYLADVYLGVEGVTFVGNGTGSPRVPAGCVMTGLNTIYTNPSAFVQDMYYRPIWKTYGNGNSRVVGQL